MENSPLVLRSFVRSESENFSHFREQTHREDIFAFSSSLKVQTVLLGKRGHNSHQQQQQIVMKIHYSSYHDKEVPSEQVGHEDEGDGEGEAEARADAQKVLDSKVKSESVVAKGGEKNNGHQDGLKKEEEVDKREIRKLDQ